MLFLILTLFFFFFNDPSTSEIYTLSLHDALPISMKKARRSSKKCLANLMKKIKKPFKLVLINTSLKDRKSTRLNSSHVAISYAVFCLKKKKKKIIIKVKSR